MSWAAAGATPKTTAMTSTKLRNTARGSYKCIASSYLAACEFTSCGCWQEPLRCFMMMIIAAALRSNRATFRPGDACGQLPWAIVEQQGGCHVQGQANQDIGILGCARGRHRYARHRSGAAAELRQSATQYGAGAGLRGRPVLAEADQRSARHGDWGVGRRAGPYLDHPPQLGDAAQQREGRRAQSANRGMLQGRPAGTGIRHRRQPVALLARPGTGL